MKANVQLYVTDWAPNGTNDLLVEVNGDIVDTLTEATVGIDICKLPGWLKGEYDAAVNLDIVNRHLAVSPVLDRSAAEERVLAFLNKNGVI